MGSMSDPEAARVEQSIDEASEMGWMLGVSEERQDLWKAWGGPKILNPPTGVQGSELAAGASAAEAAEAGLAVIRDRHSPQQV
jgi:hypothetical protein